MPSGDTESESADRSNVMGLFAENLSQVSALLEEVRLIMEDTDLSIANTERTVMWDICTTDEHGELFDSCGVMVADKRAALDNLKRQRVRRPNAYLARVLFTRCGPEEERVEAKLH